MTSLVNSAHTAWFPQQTTTFNHSFTKRYHTRGQSVSNYEAICFKM